jgi:hypothetical protein
MRLTKHRARGAVRPARHGEGEDERPRRAADRGTGTTTRSRRRASCRRAAARPRPALARLLTGAATLLLAMTGLAVIGTSAAAAAVAKLAWSGTANFGTLNAGDSSSGQFTLTNTGTKRSKALTVSLSGSPAFSITSDGCSGKKLRKGKSCTVTVEYAPADAGQQDTATLTASTAKVSGSISLTGASSNLTTTVVTDNATTVPGGPPPVTFGGTIVFAAKIASAAGTTPAGTVQWTLSQEGPAAAASASGIVGACQGNVPVVNGVATCSVTPGYYDDPDEGTYPFYWGIGATATFTPAAGSGFLASGGSDDTDKITVGSTIWSDGSLNCPAADCDPYVPVDAPPGTPLEPALSVSATDSLGRNLAYWWCTPGCYNSTDVGTVTSYPGPGLSTMALAAVCPAGVTDPFVSDATWSGSFECNYPGLEVSFFNESQ